MQIHTRRSNTTQAWHVIDGRRIFFRSAWEYRFSCHLQRQKELGVIKEWEHEPKTFWFDAIRRGCTSYKPDFLVHHNDETQEWVEVKGYYDAKSLTKIKRFRKYFPGEKLRLVDSKWFAKNTAKYR